MSRIALALLLPALLAGPAIGGEDAAVPTPKAAYQTMQKEVSEARRARDFAKARAIQQGRPKEFLEAWEKSGNVAKGEDRYYLGQMLGLAGRHADAMAAYRECLKDEDLPASLAAPCRLAFGRAVLSALGGGTLAGDAADAAIEEAEGLLDGLAGEENAAARASLHRTLGSCHDRRGRSDAAIEQWMSAARANPAVAYSMARSVMTALVGGAHRMEDYDAARERGAKLAAELISIQEGYVAKLKADEKTPERTLAGAESGLKRMPGLTRPLEMLGKPVPPWTLVHAFGKAKSLEEFEGKVVMLDFWATWCGWCIKSLPALRDLVRDFEGTDFALVGVTAPAGYVTEANYGLDEDMKDKAGEGPAPKTHRLPRDATPEQTAEYRATEKETIAKFIENHEMTWPVVMIDPGEPAEKYALTGWPHTILLDRQGRVRYFKRGALLRDRAEQVEKFRKVLKALLAEGGE